MRRHIILVVISLVALPTAFATLNSVDLTFNDAPSHRVTPDTDKLTDITFQFTPSGDLTSPTASFNAENLTADQRDGYTYSVDLQSCQLQSGTYTCTITSQDHGAIYINHDETGPQQFSLTAEYEAGSQTHTASHDVVIDDTPPNATYIGPAKCQGQDTCYISPTTTTITAAFQTDTGPFQQQDVTGIYTNGNGEQPIRFADENACDDDTCQTTQDIECADGATTTFTLNTQGTPFPPTQDDAGNTLAETPETVATCDAQPPIIQDLAIDGSTAGTPTVSSGGTITLNTTDNVDGDLTVTASIPETNTTTTCAPGQRCTAQLPTPTSTGEQDLTITAEDRAGNTAQTTRQVRYRATTQNTSNIWDGAQTTMLTNTINKDILQANPKAYAETTFTANKAETTLQEATIQDCTTPNNALQSIQIDHVNQEENTAYLSFTLATPNEIGRNQTIDATSFQATCNVTATGVDNTYAYLAGETEQIRLNMPLRDGQQLSQNLQNEIQETKDTIEDYNDNYNDLQQGVEMGQDVCQLGTTVEAGFGALSSTGLSLQSIPAVGQATSESVKQAENKARGLFQTAWNDYAKPACQVLSCRADFQKRGIEALNELNSQALSGLDIPQDSGAVESIENLAGGRRIDETYNPHNSFVGAAAGLCLPAVLKHIRTWRATDCSYLTCLTEGVQETGFSPAQCRAQRSQAQCTFLTQGITDSLPVYNFLSDAADQFSSIIQDPVALLGTAGTAYFCRPSTPATTYFPCEIGSTAQSFQRIADTYQQVRGSIDAYNSLREGTNPLCEQTMQRTNRDSRFYQREVQNNLNPEDHMPDDQTIPVSEFSGISVPEDDAAEAIIDYQITASGSVTAVGSYETSQGTYKVRQSGDGYEVTGPDGQTADMPTLSDGTLMPVFKGLKERLDETQTQEAISDANDALFQARMNNRPGPDVTLEEAKDIRSELDDATQSSLANADAYRVVADKIGPGASEVSQVNVGGQPADEWLAENIDGLTRSEAADLTKEQMKERIKEEMSGVEDALPSAQYNVTPWKAASWNAGQFGRGVLRARSLGFTVADDWGNNNFNEFIQSVASVPDSFANPHRKLCGQQRSGLSSAFEGDIAVNTDEQGQTQIGAIVSGVKTESRETQNTTYVVGYKATTDSSGLAFDIILSGADGTKTITEALTGSSPIQATQDNNAYTASGQSSIEVADDYNTVCLDFTSEPSQYFRRTDLSNGDLCQPIRS